MNIDEAREHYYTHSGSASSSARQLAFAGIAVIWILATQDVPLIEGNTEWRLPLITFVCALALDLIQYYWLAGFWAILSRIKEIREETEFDGAPAWGNSIGIVCFWLKGGLVAIGYLFLIYLLWPVLFQ